ncbi:MAG: tetratricopeptide repeat protein, partial [Planctomycetota bacterium]
GALADANRAIELDPKNALAWALRGCCRSNRGDQPSAIADFDQAIALDPKADQAWVNRGIARAKAGEARGALADFDRAIELRRTAFALRHRAGVKKLLEDFEGELADLDAGVALDPKDPYLRLGRASSSWQASRHATVIEDATIALDARVGEAWRMHGLRGNSRAQVGDVPGAIEDLEAAARGTSDPRIAEALRIEIERLRAAAPR